MATINPFNNNKGAQYADIRTGWTIRVFQKIKDGAKTRVQAFEGVVISRKHGGEAGATITVRKTSGGYGVEKVYPVHSPTIDKIEIIKQAKVARKAKLYYLRDKTAKEIRRKTKASLAQKPEGEAEEIVETPEATE